MKKIISLILLLCSLSVYSQTRLIVPFTAGGAFDLMARQFAKFAEEKIVVENIPGAGGLIGHRQFSKIEPNSLMVTSSSFYVNLVEREIDLDNYKVVSIIAESPMLLLTNKNKNISCNSIRNNSKKYFIGTAGRGHTSALAGLITVQYPNITEVPYKGVAQSTFDLLSGQLDLIVAAPTDLKPELLPLANSSDRSFNSIPSLKECLGVNDTYQLQWILLASLGSDDAFIKKYNTLVQMFTKDSDTIDSLQKRMIVPVGTDINRSSRIVQSELRNWSRILK